MQGVSWDTYKQLDPLVVKQRDAIAGEVFSTKQWFAVGAVFLILITIVLVYKFS